MVKPIRFTKAARKHKIGRAKVYEVIADGAAEEVVATSGVPGLAFTGIVKGNRGGLFELTVIVIEVPDCFLVIHVQPNYRRST